MTNTGVHDLWLFMVTVLVLNATPGVDMMLTASRTLQHGLRAGLATAAGISAGCVVHTLAAAFGLAALLAASAAAFTVLKVIGAAYLIWIAFGMLRSALRGDAPLDASAPAASARSASPGVWSLFRQGLLTNVLNPKIALFFLALLPQFIDAQATEKSAAFLFLGAVMIIQGAVFLAVFVALIAHLRRLRTNPRLSRGVNGAGGLVLLGLAARLALAERP
jgi:threonine/homoserine/homoserine lactone efflux protein